MRMRHFLLEFLCLLWLGACGGGSPEGADDPALRQLESVARHLTGPRHLRQSAYPGIRTSDRPSELVSYLFSDIGVAEWPAGDSGGAIEREQMQATRTPMLPAEGALVHARPDPRIGRQLVLSGDDDSGEIVATAYLDPTRPPVYTERWGMPEFRDSPKER